MRRCEMQILTPNHSTLHFTLLQGQRERPPSLPKGPGSKVVRMFSILSTFKQTCRSVPNFSSVCASPVKKGRSVSSALPGTPVYQVSPPSSWNGTVAGCGARSAGLGGMEAGRDRPTTTAELCVKCPVPM